MRKPQTGYAMDESLTLESAFIKIAELQFQLSEREMEVQSLRMEISELREATQTLSTWVEKLAGTIEAECGAGQPPKQR